MVALALQLLKCSCLLALVLTAGSCLCASSESDSSCESVITEILRLQELRSTRMKEVNVILTSYDEGQIERDEMLKHSRAWQTDENRLRGEVADLYIEARAGSCL